MFDKNMGSGDYRYMSCSAMTEQEITQSIIHGQHGFDYTVNHAATGKALGCRVRMIEIPGAGWYGYFYNTRDAMRHGPVRPCQSGDLFNTCNALAAALARTVAASAKRVGGRVTELRRDAEIAYLRADRAAHAQPGKPCCKVCGGTYNLDSHEGIEICNLCDDEIRGERDGE